MKKFILSTVSALVAFSAAQAESNFAGFYAGAQVGVASTVLSVKDSSVVNGTTTSYKKNSYGSTNFTGTLLGGYGQTFDSVYAGGEVRIGLLGGSSKVAATGSSSANYSPKESYIVAGRLGYLATEKAMVFFSLGLGTERSEYKATMGSNSYSNKKNDFVIVPGIGTEIAMSESLNFRADLNVSMSNRKNTTETYPSGSTRKDETHFKTTRTSLMVGLSYKF